MFLPIELLPFRVRERLGDLPPRLLTAVRDAQGRAVLRDWARERSHPELLEALRPEHFFRHALGLIVDDVAPGEDAEVEVSIDHLVVKIRQRDFRWSRQSDGVPNLEDYCAGTWPWRDQLREAIWELGLRTTGLDELFCAQEGDGARGVDSDLRWYSGWEPRSELERFRVSS
ncbi:MAG: hypothetical protein KTR31_36290 [Myxococcales bacterium]|nr:hypothetical protein [Myxococcales bacterium]